MADVVVDLNIFVVFERQFYGEIHLDRVVVDSAVLKLPALDAVVPIPLAELRTGESIIVDLSIPCPDAKDCAT